MPDLISTLNLTVIDNVRLEFEKHINKKLLDDYRLPVSTTKANVIIGLSGGSDSSVLAMFAAIFLAPHYPNIQYLFTDTKAEPKSCYETLNKLEKLLAIKITRLIPEVGLFELIDSYNGFLPSSRDRYCTKQLKINPLMSFVANLPKDAPFISLAGIRIDEADREGVTFSHDLERGLSAYPFIDLGITKAQVLSILNATIGIPSTYRYKSRSGCFSCFFARNSEILGMLHHDPVSFMIAEGYEKLCEEDKARWNNMPKLLSNIGIRPYYPVPSFVDIRHSDRFPKKRPTFSKQLNSPMEDLFGFSDNEGIDSGDDLFIAIGLYVNEALGAFGGREFTPGVYWSEFITISPSYEGLNVALGNYYEYRKTTPMPIYDVADLKIVIVQIRFYKGVIDAAGPSSQSYTWKKGVAYKQLRHLAAQCQSVLETTDLERRSRQCKTIMKDARASGDVDAYLDARESLAEVLQSKRAIGCKQNGRIIWEGIFTPSRKVKKAVQLQLEGVSIETLKINPPREGLEFDEVARACIACQI